MYLKKRIAFLTENFGEADPGVDPDLPPFSGLTSSSLNNEVRCFSDGEGYIRFVLPACQTDVHVDICSISGTLLYSKILSDDRMMDVSALSSGVYIAKVIMSTHTYHLKFFV